MHLISCSQSLHIKMSLSLLIVYKGSSWDLTFRHCPALLTPVSPRTNCAFEKSDIQSSFASFCFAICTCKAPHVCLMALKSVWNWRGRGGGGGEGRKGGLLAYKWQGTGLVAPQGEQAQPGMEEYSLQTALLTPGLLAALWVRTST